MAALLNACVFFVATGPFVTRNADVEKSGAEGGTPGVPLRLRGRRAQPLLLLVRGLRRDYLAERYAPLQLR